jgi:hypothetical protein
MKQDLLKQEVDRAFGHQLKEARDFEQLSHLLLSHTRERLSLTTLKRLKCVSPFLSFSPHLIEPLSNYTKKHYANFYNLLYTYNILKNETVGDALIVFPN